MANSGIARRIDDVQRERRLVATTLATFKKYQEDRSSRLASMVAFWAFFSVFPLFLLLVSLLGFFLPQSTKSNVMDHVAAMFPLLDPSTVGRLSGSAWSVILGGATALWGGTAVMGSAQFAFNSVWEIPMTDRPKFVGQLTRSLKALVIIGTGLVVSAIVSGFVTGQNSGVNLGVAGRIGGYVFAAVLDVALFALAFKMLTEKELTYRDVLPGAVLSGLAFWVLEQVSSFIISRKLQHTQSTYGHFATVITILWWFYLQSMITLLGAQLNVVLHDRLHPRSLAGGSRTEADRRTLGSYASSRAYEEGERVETDIPDPPDTGSEGRSRPA